MKWTESTAYENPPAGSHIARCFSIVDMGSQQHSWQGEAWVSRDVRISFELPTELMTGRYNQAVKGLPFSVHTTVKQSLHGKSRLRALLEGWAGKKMTKDSIATFDPRKLLGMPCRIALVEDGEYTNISSISPLSRGEICPKQINPSVFFSLEKGEFDQKVFDGLHEKTREKIAKSAEWFLLDSSQPQGGTVGGEQGPEPGPEPEPEPESDPF